MSTKKPTPTWIDVKTKLSNFDQAGLISLVQDLYAASKDTRTFLHARLRLGGDALAPYKATINRRLWPDMLQQQDTSVAARVKGVVAFVMQPTAVYLCSSDAPQRPSRAPD